MTRLLPDRAPQRATEAELREAWTRAYRTRGIPFDTACADPLYRAALELGAAIARRPRPARVDGKALAARNDN